MFMAGMCVADRAILDQLRQEDVSAILEVALVAMNSAGAETSEGNATGPSGIKVM
jgi:hypothetical protein